MDFELFEKIERESYSVFKNKAVLSLDFVPDVMVGRERAQAAQYPLPVIRSRSVPLTT